MNVQYPTSDHRADQLPVWYTATTGTDLTVEAPQPIEYLTSVNHPQHVVFKTESAWNS